ncbi:MAG: glycerol-3-phosphate acyltransferase [Oscillospiraceae bacterium]|nr:glycerol-3-phosphate acyltransferase [Oscillospiraceae bacterium]
MAYIIGAILGYFLGCINMANIISKSRGIDIKKVGSNNAGASNVFISVGKMYGVAVGVFDILKAFSAAGIIYIIFSNNLLAAIIAGAMAVMGHIFPFWMKFNGGKGLAPFMGLVLFYDWKLFIVFALLIVAITLITDFIGIGALTVTVLLPVYAAFFRDEIAIALIFTVVSTVMWCKHIENIKRIANGTEIGFLRKNKIKK